VVITDIAQFSYKTDTVLTVTVIIDMRDSGELLGSTTATVTWNPNLLFYQSAAGGSPGVTTYVNLSNVANGRWSSRWRIPTGSPVGWSC